LTERRTLALAMLGDVLTALRDTKLFEQVLLVSRDERALLCAPDLGVTGLPERGSRGYSAAANQAAVAAGESGVDGLLVLPGDVPLVRPDDIQALVEAVNGAPVGLVPSQRRDGTNAVLAKPPGVLRFRFGRGSFAAHLRQASALGEYRVVELANLALDLDTPDDLRSLLTQHGGAAATATGRYLRTSGLAARLTGPAV
jgi:2-phospho-L-lactate guanylyltransferase